MLVTQITNHVQAGLARLLQQYQGLPLLTGFLTAFLQQMQDLENGLFPLDAGRQLFNGTSYPAVGLQLDNLGTLVGISRNGLSDAEYLLFILGTIAENNSDSTINSFLNVVNFIFNPDFALIYQMGMAEINLEVAGSPLSPALYNVAGNIIQNTLGAGIDLGFIATFNETNAFRFGDINGHISPGTGAGFGDLSNPLIGGLWATLIY